MPNAIIKFKIKGLGITDKEYRSMPFGRQIEYRRKIDDFMSRAKSVHISQKRRTHAAAWKEFKGLYEPEEYYASYHDESGYRDDSFQVWYIPKSTDTGS